MSEAEQSAFLIKVYDLILSAPINPTDDEEVEDETEIDIAIKADRFSLLVAVRELAKSEQLSLPL